MERSNKMDVDDIFHMDDEKSNTYPTPNGEVKVDYTVVERIRAAAEEAKKDLAAPPAVMVVEKQFRKTLIVNIVDNRLVIYHQSPGQLGNNGLEKLYDEPTDKFRSVLFLYCKDCRIFVMSKVLKLAVIQCDQCQISVRGGVIGPVELFRCVDTNVDIRSAFPVLTSELCKNVHMYQRQEQSIYGIIGGSNCTINKVDPITGQRLASYPVDDLFGSRRFYHLAGTEMHYVAEEYLLNNIETHLMALPPETNTEEEPPFGQTPPSVGFFTYHPNSRPTPRFIPGPQNCGWQAN
jgi:hypothetical protein